MTEDKKSRLIVSATVVSVLLLFILVVILIYQMASYSAVKRQKAALEAQKAQLMQEIENREEELANRKTEWQMELQARKYGLMFPDDGRFTVEGK